MPARRRRGQRRRRLFASDQKDHPFALSNAHRFHRRGLLIAIAIASEGGALRSVEDKVLSGDQSGTTRRRSSGRQYIQQLPDPWSSSYVATGRDRTSADKTIVTKERSTEELPSMS